MKKLISSLLVSLLLSLAVLCALGFGWQEYQKSQPSYAPEIRTTEATYRQAHKTNGGRMREDGKAALSRIKDRVVDTVDLFNSLAPSADRSGQMVWDEQAIKARARGQVLRVPGQFLEGTRETWWRTGVPVYEPIRVVAGGQIESLSVPREKYGPAGTYAGGLPIEHNYSGTVLPLDVAPFGAFIGRICQKDGCSQPFFIGRDRWIDPVIHGYGVLELWTNGILSEAGRESRGHFRNNIGGFSFGTCGRGKEAECDIFAASSR